MNCVYYVYRYNRIDGSPYYIGKGKDRRAWKHFKGEVYPPKDITRIQIVAHLLSESEAFQLEKKLITLFGRKDLGTGILHNKSDGGEGPSNPSFETRKKIGDFNRGKITSTETKKKISESKLGKTREPFSEEWKKNMSLVRKGKSRGPMSEETKQKIRDAQTGKKYSDEINRKKGKRNVVL